MVAQRGLPVLVHCSTGGGALGHSQAHCSRGAGCPGPLSRSLPQRTSAQGLAGWTQCAPPHHALALRSTDPTCHTGGRLGRPHSRHEAVRLPHGWGNGAPMCSAGRWSRYLPARGSFASPLPFWHGSPASSVADSAWAAGNPSTRLSRSAAPHSARAAHPSSTASTASALARFVPP